MGIERCRLTPILGLRFPISYPYSFPCFSAFGQRTAEALGSPDESPTPAEIRDPRLSCFYLCLHRFKHSTLLFPRGPAPTTSQLPTACLVGRTTTDAGESLVPASDSPCPSTTGQRPGTSLRVQPLRQACRLEPPLPTYVSSNLPAPCSR